MNRKFSITLRANNNFMFLPPTIETPLFCFCDFHMSFSQQPSNYLSATSIWTSLALKKNFVALNSMLILRFPYVFSLTFSVTKQKEKWIIGSHCADPYLHGQTAVTVLIKSVCHRFLQSFRSCNFFTCFYITIFAGSERVSEKEN